MQNEAPTAGIPLARWTIRPARAEDKRQLGQILGESPGAANWIPEWSPGEDESGSSSVVLVVSDIAEVSGFAAGRCAGTEAEILNVAVRANERRKGIASQLLQELVTHLRERGAERIFLEVRQSNTAAIALYEKQWFERAGVRRGYYRNPDEDALVYEKKLI